MRVSVVTFPGSNCDHDLLYAYGEIFGEDVRDIWHKDRDLKNPDIVLIPGGFSYGDYLRTGALAKLSPIMEEVVKFANSGGPVLGICNGFQILCESGLLPGALLQNVQMKFLSQFVYIRVENNTTPFSCGAKKGEVICSPIAHFEGNYFADCETLKRLEDNGQVVVRYCSSDGRVDPDDLELNPNGSANAIAGICNRAGNVVGMMPHPERVCEKLVGYIGGDSGKAILMSPAERIAK